MSGIDHPLAEHDLGEVGAQRHDLVMLSKPSVLAPSLVIVTACVSTPAPRPDPAAELPPLAIVKTVFDGVTVHTLEAPEQSTGVTAHVLETAEHLVVVDTQLFVPHSKVLRAYCEDLNKPIERVILSHGHPDHYFGMTEFQDVPTYALAETRQHVEARHGAHHRMRKRWSGALVPDEVNFVQATLEPGPFEIDGLEVEVEAMVGGEDGVQAVLWLPAQRALIAQDLTTNGYHAYVGAEDLDRWIEHLRTLQARTPEHVFSGHGAPGGAEVLGETVRYLEVAKRLSAEAETEQALAEALKAAFPKRKSPFLTKISAMMIFMGR